MLESLREQANRDDGRYFQVGNRQVGTLEVMDLLSLVMGLALRHFHERAGLDISWAIGFGIGGSLIFALHVLLTIRRQPAAGESAKQPATPRIP